MKRKFILNIIIFILIFTLSIFANGAEPEMPFNDGDGALHFKDESNISLVDEEVRLTISSNDSQEVGVDVTYNLLGPNLAEDTEMYFVLSEPNSYKVYVNEQEITADTRLEILPEIDNWEPIYDFKIYDPVVEKDIGYGSSHKMVGSNNMSTLYGIVIPISFESKEEVNLRVQYSSNSGKYKGVGSDYIIMSYVYYMTPARYWKDEPRITYSVTFPENGKYALYSAIELDKISDIYYEKTQDYLPDEEWLISYTNTEVTRFTLVTAFNILYGFILAVLIIILLILLTIGGVYLTNRIVKKKTIKND